jgi:LmbE family N-acetylglucosaminyl deacetylase
MRPVLVALHAHPDDEAIFTGGTIVRAVEAGWRVVLVLATDGDRGAGPGRSSGDVATHRRAEAATAAAILGIERVEFLGYGDSGWADTAGDRSGVASARGLAGGSLAAAHLDNVADSVRRILVEEHAVALTSYDDNGIYGHVDHVRVHEIAVRAVAGTPCELYEATLDRAALRRLRAGLVARGLLADRWPTELVDRLGLEPGPGLVTVDVTGQLGRKLEAVAAHSSQMVEAASFMGLPAGAFHHLLGTEWFRAARIGPGRFLDLLWQSGTTLPAPSPRLVHSSAL